MTIARGSEQSFWMSEAKEAAKNSYIADWISTHGDPQTQEQFRDGLLCRKSILSLIADYAFAAAGVPAGFEEEDWECCENSACPCGLKDVTCLPRSIYPAWKVINRNLPEGSTVTFQVSRRCLRPEWDGEGESAAPAIYLATIKLQHGPFEFERTVQL